MNPPKPFDEMTREELCIYLATMEGYRYVEPRQNWDIEKGYYGKRTIEGWREVDDPPGYMQLIPIPDYFDPLIALETFKKTKGSLFWSENYQTYIAVCVLNDKSIDYWHKTDPILAILIVYAIWLKRTAERSDD